MTYDMHNTDKLGVFREEANHLGIALLPPDVNRSEVLFAVELSEKDASNPPPDTRHPSPNSIRYALAAIRNVGAQAMEEVVRERKNGPYQDIFDFVTRVPGESLNRRALEHLIKAGAFDALHPNRNQLFGNIDLIMGYGASSQRDRDSQQVSLFGSGNEIIPKPKLAEITDWTTLERLEHEFSAIGFYLSSHPLGGYKLALDGLRVTSSANFVDKLDSQFRSIKVAGIVTGRKFKSSDKGRFAFIQLSDMGGIFEVSIFNELLLNQHREILENGKILLMSVDAKMEEGGGRFIAQTISLFDDALIKHQQIKGASSSFRITVNQQEALTPIRELLGRPVPKGAKITLSAQLGNERAEIQLPDKYTLSPIVLDKIRVIKGVVSAEEIAA